MNIKKITTLALLFASTAIFAQDDLSIAPFKKDLTNKQVLDSIKASFVHDKIASCIDSLWMKELASLDLYNELTLDIKNINVDEKVDMLASNLSHHSEKVVTMVFANQKSDMRLEMLETQAKESTSVKKGALKWFAGITATILGAYLLTRMGLK
jgi:hypothetical protein